MCGASPWPAVSAIFKQLFANGQHFTYSLEDIGRYYRTYVELMAHWERVCLGRFCACSTRIWSTDLEATCGGFWNSAASISSRRCVEFHRTGRTVHTPSSEQVQPADLSRRHRSVAQFRALAGPVDGMAPGTIGV